MSSNDSTINLDDSSVMSSTKNSSVLEVTDDSVIDVSDSTDTEGDDDDVTEEADTVNTTSENIDSSSERLVRENSRELTDDDLAITRESTEEDVTSTDHYVTSVQTISESVNDESVLSASELVSEFDFSSNQATKDESSIISDTLTRDLAEHTMRLSESVVEGLGENIVNNNDTIEELSNDLASKIKIMNDLKQATSNNSSVVENVDKSIEETFRDKSIAQSFGGEDELENDDQPEEASGSPHKRKSKDGVVEDRMTVSSSSFHEAPAKRPKTESPELPSTCQLLVSHSTGAKVYLVGTAHFSKESCEDVRKVIESVQPDIVVIELCKARTNLLQLDDQTILEEAQNLSLDKSLEIIRQQGTVQGVMYLLLLSMSAHLTKELGMAPGGEFRTAFQEANKVSGCIVQLGDRPINITLKRAMASLSWWQTLRLGWNIISNKDPITKEDVENCKNKDLLQNMLAEMAGEFPALSSVFVEERDIFLTHSLQMASEAIPAHALSAGGQKIDSYTPPTVVGVVGIGHMPGIMDKWGTVTHDQVREVVRVTPPSLLSRAASFSIKTLFWGGCLYGAYKLVRGPTSRLLLVR